MNVCCEDTFKRIMERYSIFNKDPETYTWRLVDLRCCLQKNVCTSQNILIIINGNSGRPEQVVAHIAM